jgi:hypothetical protein
LAGARDSPHGLREGVNSGGEKVWTAFWRVQVVQLREEDDVKVMDVTIGPARRQQSHAEYDIMAGWRKLTRQKVADEVLPFHRHMGAGRARRDTSRQPSHARVIGDGSFGQP